MKSYVASFFRVLFGFIYRSTRSHLISHRPTAPQIKKKLTIKVGSALHTNTAGREIRCRRDQKVGPRENT